MKRTRQSSLIFILAAMAIMGSSPSFAFDASKIIKKDTPASQIFSFFFNFKKNGQSEEAVEVLKYAADVGNSAAQWKLARIYQTGDGIKQNSLEAFAIFEKIANQVTYAIPNSPNWQYRADAFVALGDYYRNGIPNTPIKADEGKARVMYTTAAMIFRHPDAQFELGRLQVRNETIYGQAKSGVRNLSLAYNKGHVGAEALLGYLIFEGVHAKHDPVRGLFMLGNAKRRASDKDIEWINQLYDEAYSIARPNERTQAVEKITAASTSLE